MDFMHYKLDQPVHEDCRLESTEELLKKARAKWLKADLDHPSTANKLRADYEWLKRELNKGNSYQPKF